MKKIHAQTEINGIVQGVGFRPFIHKRASDFGLFGEIRNTSFGVSLSLEGEKGSVEAFLRTLAESSPPAAEIYEMKTQFSDTLCGYKSFRIAESEAGERRTFISPDLAVCDDCIAELFEKEDRRYRYPFINCTNCGPRFTITRDIPYDRKNTTMAQFPMCDPCAAEYSDIEDRRYHAQPDACDVCGPHLSFLDGDCREVGGDAIENTKALFLRGGICAIKGLGGFHLAVCAKNEEAVRLLRTRKGRDEKPFAVMCRDIATVREIARVTPDEERLLTSSRRPILLLEKKEKDSFKYISENGYIGVMLPYTPVHYLLTEGETPFLVMTSANLSAMPIIYKNEEATEKLRGIADGYLINDREIFVRCDDSLAWELDGDEYFVRRSRGYAPLPLAGVRADKNILAVGAEQKASFSLSRGGKVFPSAHIGDLKNIETLDCFTEQVSHYERIFDVKPELLICDMHPDYLSGEYARVRAKREDIPLLGAYHHHAHMASCMADNAIDEKCIGIIWDGTGYGADGEAWGAEILYGDYSGFVRKGTIEKIRLPGGDVATREITRTGASLLLDAEVDPTSIFPSAEKFIRMLELGINSPSVTSMGRLFDGVSAILGISDFSSYEGRAAMLLEAVADESVKEAYSYEITSSDGVYVFSMRQMIKEIADGVRCGEACGVSAAKFMNTLILSASDMAEQIARDTGVRKVVLSGGSFQNMYILKRLCKELTRRGLSVYKHRKVSTNDEGISLGQLMIAERGGGINVPCSTT